VPYEFTARGGSLLCRLQRLAEGGELQRAGILGAPNFCTGRVRLTRAMKGERSLKKLFASLTADIVAVHTDAKTILCRRNILLTLKSNQHIIAAIYC
jgi:hypothetical protein